MNNNYRYSRKTWPAVSNLIDPDHLGDELGTVVVTEQTRRGSGHWTKGDTHTQSMTRGHYLNYIDSVPFFRSLGGTERVEMGYCIAGYPPLRITSTSPDRQTRFVRTFQITKF